MLQDYILLIHMNSDMLHYNLLYNLDVDIDLLGNKHIMEKFVVPV